MEAENKNRELKHLGFMRMAAIQVVVCVSNLYGFAKQKSGPLKSTVGTVEGAVGTVVTPAYNKFKDVSDDLLVFIDKKVDEASHKFDEHAPTVAKQVVSQANTIIQTASEKAQSFVKEARTRGPRAAIYYAASEYKQFLLTNSVKAWIKVNKYQPIHTVAEKALQPAKQLSEKYNHLMENMTVKGYPVVGYLPLIPVDEIARTYDKENEAVKKPGENGKTSSSDSDSDSH